MAEVEELVKDEGSAAVKRHERLDRVVLVSGLRKRAGVGSSPVCPHVTEDVVRMAAFLPAVLFKSSVANGFAGVSPCS